MNLEGKLKRPHSAYMFWLSANRVKIKEDYPGLSGRDISKKAGALWKEVTDRTVSKFVLNT